MLAIDINPALKRRLREREVAIAFILDRQRLVPARKVSAVMRRYNSTASTGYDTHSYLCGKRPEGTL